MQTSTRPVWKTEGIYAACQGTYWSAYCAVFGFVTVFLSYRGLSDTNIGLVTAFGSALAIVLQLVLSRYSDRHPGQPLKRLLSLLMATGLVSGACVQFLPLSAALLIPVFGICYATIKTDSAYLNALPVQFNNAGIPVRFGWPRGVGSFCYAAIAWLLGVLVKRSSPDILMPSFLLMMGLSLVFVLLMPYPDHRLIRREDNARDTSYREMLTGNRALTAVLLCILLNNIGHMASYTFTLRVVERLGGGTAEYGIGEFIRACAEVPALFASGLLLKRFRAGTLLTASFAFYGIRILLLAVTPSMGFFYLASLLNIVCVGLYCFSSVLFVNTIVRSTEKVRGQSLCVLCSSLGTIIGSALAGAMIDSLGLTAMLISASLFCFAACAGMLLFCPRQPKAAA